MPEEGKPDHRDTAVFKYGQYSRCLNFLVILSTDSAYVPPSAEVLCVRGKKLDRDSCKEELICNLV